MKTLPEFSQKRKFGNCWGYKMFKIKNGTIYHTRGDTADFDLNIILDNESVEDGYTAIFSVKKKISDSFYTFQVHASDGHISIPHSLTQNLAYGEYVYDIEICINDESTEGRYITIGPFPYFLTPDVTTT